MINNLSNHNEINVTYFEVCCLEEFVYTMEENNIDDKVEDDTIPLESVTHKKALIASRTLF